MQTFFWEDLFGLLLAELCFCTLELFFGTEGARESSNTQHIPFQVETLTWGNGGFCLLQAIWSYNNWLRFLNMMKTSLSRQLRSTNRCCSSCSQQWSSRCLQASTINWCNPGTFFESTNTNLQSCCWCLWWAQPEIRTKSFKRSALDTICSHTAQRNSITLLLVHPHEACSQVSNLHSKNVSFSMDAVGCHVSAEIAMVRVYGSLLKRLAQASSDTSCEDARLVASKQHCYRISWFHHMMLEPVLHDVMDIRTDIILEQNDQNASFPAATNQSEIYFIY